MSEATLKSKLTGDSAEFQRSLREGIEAAREFGDKVGESIRETVLQVAALTIGVDSLREGFEKVYDGVKGVFDLSRDLRNLSNQTGASVRDLVQLRAEFDLSGIAADQVGSVLNRMQRAIENASDKGGQASEIFSRMGINIYELQQLNPAQQFDLLRQRLVAIEDPARRAQLAMKLFGNMGGGGDLLAVFGNSNIAKEAADVISDQANILSRNAKTFQEVSVLLETAGINMEGFFIGMAEPISRVILPILQKIDSLDMTKWGSAIGNSITEAIRVLYNAFEGDQFGTLMKLSFETGLDYLGGGLKGAATAFGDSILDLFSMNFAEAVGGVFTGIAEQFGAALMVAVGRPLSVIQAAMSYEMDRHDALKNRDAANQNAGQYDRVADTAFRREAALRRSGNNTGADREASIADDATSKASAARNDAIRFEQMRTMSMQDYISANSKPATFFGLNAGEMENKGQNDVAGGLALLKPIVSDAASKAFGDLKDIKPLDMFGGAGDKLEDFIRTHSAPVPGEGKQNAPDEPTNRSGGRDFFGAASVEGIHQNENGGWSFFSSSGQGGVNFGGDGMSDRAGRVVANPDGPDPGQQLATAIGYLKSISAAVNSVMEPA
jgi:hypothetical protein